jgi:hypothetical protein
MDISPSVISDSFIFQGDEDPQLFFGVFTKWQKGFGPNSGRKPGANWAFVCLHGYRRRSKWRRLAKQISAQMVITTDQKL